jgi:hypothetical protein
MDNGLGPFHSVGLDANLGLLMAITPPHGHGQKDLCSRQTRLFPGVNAGEKIFVLARAAYGIIMKLAIRPQNVSDIAFYPFGSINKAKSICWRGVSTVNFYGIRFSYSWSRNQELIVPIRCRCWNIGFESTQMDFWRRIVI